MLSFFLLVVSNPDNQLAAQKGSKQAKSGLSARVPSWAPSASWLVCSNTRENSSSIKAQGGCGNQKLGQLEMNCMNLDSSHDFNIH